MSTHIIHGKDFNFYQEVTVTETNFPEGEAQVNINIRDQAGFYLINNDSTNIVSFSFNGTTVHGKLKPGKASAALMFDDRRVSHIWLKTDGGSPVVDVAAWAKV